MRHLIGSWRELHERLKPVHPFVFTKAASDTGGRRIALLVVEKGRKGIWRLVTATFMLTGDTWVPADSSHDRLRPT